jgi:flagellar basal-body rod protein FlgF
MIYGLHISASGIMSNSYKQDVVANNLANAETPGFKRDIPLFQQRLTEADQRRTLGRPKGWSDPSLANIGGGLLIAPTAPDASQGDMDPTGSPLDVAIQGTGFFAVAKGGGDGGPGGGGASGGPDAGGVSLTRNGQFMIDRQGYLVLGTDTARQVLDVNRRPIRVSGDGGGQLAVGKDGTLTQGTATVARIGVFNVADPSKLAKQGGTLLTYPDEAGLSASTAMVRGETVERSNVDPTTELTELMKTQRLLEANANMIRVQDQTLAKLVNEVGKIS